MYKKQIHSHINNINFAIKWFVLQAKTTLSYTCYISTSILWSPNRHPQCILYFFFSQARRWLYQRPLSINFQVVTWYMLVHMFSLWFDIYLCWFTWIFFSSNLHCNPKMCTLFSWCEFVFLKTPTFYLGPPSPHPACTTPLVSPPDFYLGLQSTISIRK